MSDTIEPGVYLNISNDAYHKSEGVSKSGLDLIAKCPAKYKHRYIDGNHPPPTKALKVGPAFHTAILEPEKFDAEFLVAPKIDKRTKAGKEEWEEFQAEAEGKTVLEIEDYDQIIMMARSVRQHPIASQLLSLGHAETSIYAIDDSTGELVKIRPDWLHEDMIVDLKSTEDASTGAFSRSCGNDRYHVQAGMYLNVANTALNGRFGNFIFIAVEKSPPYQVSVYYADKDMLQLGYEEYRRNLELFSQCKQSGIWPGYNGGTIQPITVPKWAR